MKKILALMLALIMCFAMLVACGPEEESSSSEESESQSQSESAGDTPTENTEYDNVVSFN